MDLKRSVIAIMVLFMSGMSGIAGADELWLSNGDHLTGKVIGMEAEKLQFETTYTGKITVSWKAISKLRTDGTVSVVLRDGSLAKGIVEAGGAGKINMKSESMEAPVTFLLSEVKEINPPPQGPPVKLKGRVNIGVTVTSGNTETATYYGEGQLTARAEDNRFTIGARFDREKDHGELTADQQAGYMRYDRFVTKKLFFEANGAGTKDEFRDLRLRSAFGVGAGYQFFETDRTNLSFETGVNYVNESHIVAEDKSFMAGRWALHFDHFLYKKALQFFHSHEGLISLEDAEDLIIQSQTGFRFLLFKNFNATAQLNYDWDKSPSPGIKKGDATYLITVGCQF